MSGMVRDYGHRGGKQASELGACLVRWQHDVTTSSDRQLVGKHWDDSRLLGAPEAVVDVAGVFRRPPTPGYSSLFIAIHRYSSLFIAIHRYSSLFIAIHRHAPSVGVMHLGPAGHGTWL
jgi:hypothetical protein